MKLAVFSGCLRLCVVIAVAACAGLRAFSEGEKCRRVELCGIACSAAQHMCLLLTYYSVGGVVVGLFQMTPENCSPRTSPTAGWQVPMAPPLVSFAAAVA